MDTLNFEFSNNKEEVRGLLNSRGYQKIGHMKENCVGFCIMINRKQYFELSAIRNPSIYRTQNISDVNLYCT